MSDESPSTEIGEKTFHEEVKPTFRRADRPEAARRRPDACLGQDVGEVLQSLEVSQATLSRWRSQYGSQSRCIGLRSLSKTRSIRWDDIACETAANGGACEARAVAARLKT
jgi:hypothetical protein